MIRWMLAACLVVAGCSNPVPTLHVFNWPDYFASDTIANFEKEFGCKVVLDYFDSPEMLRAKLEHPPSGFDVVFPSDEIVPSLVSASLVEPLDRTKIPNFVHIDARFKGLDFDRTNTHTVPYMWGMTGVAWNTKSVPGGINSWKQLFDGAGTRKSTYLDDGHEVLVAAMFANGDDPRKPTAETIRRAAERVSKAKPTGWDSAPKTRLVVGDHAVAHAFSGDARQAAVAPERVADIGFAIPEEGGTIFVDNIAVAKGTGQSELAHAFVNYLLRPDVSASITREMKFGNPNAAARALLPKELLDDPIVNPPESTLKRCVFLPVLTSEQRGLIEAAWAEIKGRG